ncbi:MAG: hypothetical protein LBD57_04265 [Endomicrobium sp.]|jgi:hypothetical protein|uniref:hypothetical protein n=1 Tax=Candidatus Endomicrobiellum cubanum TaxID=3242325 RepID=UPI0028281A32|nr:hypothetical protein [Endomicrobium sp.]
MKILEGRLLQGLNVITPDHIKDKLKLMIAESEKKKNCTDVEVTSNDAIEE